MSRWLQQFEDHAFQSVWTSLKKSLDGSTVDDETVVTSVEEMARLKKVVAYVDEMLQGIDPELVPIGTWDSFNKQATACAQQISTYNNDRDITHITQANTHADNLLTYIRPYMVADGEMGKALQESVKQYSKTVDEYLDSYVEKSSSLIDDITEIKNESDKLYSSIETVKNSVDEFNGELFGDGEEVNIEDRIRALSSEVEEKYQAIIEYYNELLVGDESEDSTKKLVIQAKEKILEEKDEIESLLESVSMEVKELEKFHTKVFGKVVEDEGEDNGKEVRSGGLSSNLDQLIKALNDFEGAQKEKYTALTKEIESLIPGATSAGLASAYRALRKSFAMPIKLYSKLFYASITALISISLVFIIDDIGIWYIKFVDVSSPLNVLNSLVFKLPFILPVLWLAIFASKRRSEAHRLQQEYAHKEALAKSYQSFKKQIDSLGEKDNQLLKNLLETAIGAIAFNASSTLDGKHGDKIPSQEIIEKLITEVTKKASSSKDVV